MAYDIKKHGDFRKIYDSKYKKNIWLLGYFGGGAVNLVEALELGKQFSEAVKVPLITVTIDEILYSRRYKNFKFISSTEDNQLPESDSEIMENVMNMLHD